MNILNKIVIAYLIVVLVLVHCSLFFCDESHCLYLVSKLPISRESAYYIRVGISTLIPIGFKSIQLLAQWIILIEACIIVYYLFRIIQTIISMACQLVFLGVVFGLAYLVY
jgi:hypothetical protein